MLKWINRLSRKAQTTSEYVIILALVALGSVAVILLFGNQVRQLFGLGTKKLAGQPASMSTTYSDQADQATDVKGIADAVKQP